MSERKAPQVSASELEQFLSAERLGRIESVLAARTAGLTVVLDGVHNYHNISAVIRSADAFGLKTVHLVGESFEFSRGVTLGTERWVELVAHRSSAEAVEALTKDGFRFVVTAPEDDPRRSPGVSSLPVYQLPFEEKLAVVFGNERRGVSPELFSAATIHAFIPMVGMVESLNISVACAITLFCSMFSGATAIRRPESLGAAERDALREVWLQKGVRHSEAILREIGRRAGEDDGD